MSTGDPRVTVSVTGASFGDITFSRDARMLVEYNDADDAYQLALVIEEFAATLRSLYPAPKLKLADHATSNVSADTNGHWSGNCRCGWYVTELGKLPTEAALIKHVKEAL